MAVTRPRPRAEQLEHPELARLDRPTPLDYVWGTLRILIGWLFLWAFLDKLFGFGFASETGWLDGTSPTEGFLKFGVKGPIGEWYQSFAGGSTWIDWVYMLSMLAIGVALISGVLTRLAAAGAIVWLGLFYTAALWPENNPFLDDHIVYVVVLVGIILAGAGRTIGLGRLWERTRIGRVNYWLRG